MTRGTDAMKQRISARIAAIIDALPLHPGMRVLEIGCGPGVAARAVVHRMGSGHVLAIDRSATAIAPATAGCAAEISSGMLEFRCIALEDLVLSNGELPYDLAFAIRVGVLDGRHPAKERLALHRLRAALTEGGRLYIDGGDPIRVHELER